MKINKDLQKLLKQYNVSIKRFQYLGEKEDLTQDEINDLEYIENKLTAWKHIGLIWGENYANLSNRISNIWNAKWSQFTEDFKDESWHNDACPTFISETRNILLYIDFPYEISKLKSFFLGKENHTRYMVVNNAFIDIEQRIVNDVANHSLFKTWTEVEEFLKEIKWENKWKVWQNHHGGYYRTYITTKGLNRISEVLRRGL